MSEEEKELQPLKEWRLRRHWTYARLAQNAEVSARTVMRAERGKRPHEVTQRKIADALGIQVSQIAEFAAEVRK
jgi:transcriptional regulator with XRE-family HTH domain